MHKASPCGALAACLAAFAISACTPKPKPLDQLGITPVEVGPVPVETVPGLPREENRIIVTRGNAGITTAFYRHTVPCPTRMISSKAGIKVLPDRILLCFEPFEDSSPEARPLSSCPYELAIKYEMWGVPKSVDPKFEIAPSCAGF